MMMTKETQFLKAQEEFQALVAFVNQAGVDGLRMDQVERGLWRRLLAIGLALLNAFVLSAGKGDAEPTIVCAGQTLRRLSRRRRRYVSIFGVLSIGRWVYAAGEKQRQAAPLDARLGLPEGDFSYVLLDWLQQGCVRNSFAEALAGLKPILNLSLGVRSAEHMNQQLAREVERFRFQQALPSPEEDEAILVATADGKGVPMRRPVEERTRHGIRRRKGEKANKKRMAAVGAVYSIAPFVRTPEQIVDELQRKERASHRPQPQSKHVSAELTRIQAGEEFSGKERLFVAMAVEVRERDPQHAKPLVCLMDGEAALWEMQRAWLPRAVGILDLFHVLERLWDAAHAFHPEGSDEAEAFVTHRLHMLLEGKVGYVIGGLKRLREMSGLRGSKRRTVSSTIGYFERNREHMRYDEYLAGGYPIGSGVAEGACRHLVKDRLEGTGMRWTVPGAQAMLHLRALYLNGDWETYLDHYIQTEQSTLYGHLAA